MTTRRIECSVLAFPIDDGVLEPESSPPERCAQSGSVSHDAPLCEVVLERLRAL